MHPHTGAIAKEERGKRNMTKQPQKGPLLSNLVIILKRDSSAATTWQPAVPDASL